MLSKYYGIVLFVYLMSLGIWADEPPLPLQLQKDDVIAICGDSITEQKVYSAFIEDYLLACQPGGIGNIRSFQAGWSGETASGFLGHMEYTVLPFRPTVATLCYGMNDGGYHPADQETCDAYQESLTKVIEAFKKNGVRTILVSSPGAIDTGGIGRQYDNVFKGGVDQGISYYNDALGALTNVARDVAKKEDVRFADIHTPMLDVMAQAKAKYGKEYRFVGDGIHPDTNGALVMAYVFLKTLGCDGNIGTITVDLARNTATATDGHTIDSCNNGEIQITSTRYPFCFFGKPEEQHSTSGVIEFFPFNQDLNRFTLIVTNPKTEKIKVTWGKESKVFSAAEALAGINLAANFYDNPFSDAFQKLDDTVHSQQEAERWLLKDKLMAIPGLMEFAPDEKDAYARIQTKLTAKDQEFFQASANNIKPVSYTIKISPVN